MRRVRWLWRLAMVARHWGITPRAAAREILDDPEQLALACIPLVQYAAAHAAFKRADKRELKAWKRDPMMARVTKLEHELAEAELLAPEGEGE